MFTVGPLLPSPWWTSERKHQEFLFFSLLLFCPSWMSKSAAKGVSWRRGSRTSFYSEAFFICAATYAKLLEVMTFYIPF